MAEESLKDSSKKKNYTKSSTTNRKRRKSSKKRNRSMSYITAYLPLAICMAIVLCAGLILFKNSIMLGSYSSKLAQGVGQSALLVKNNVLIDGKAYKGFNKERLVAALNKNKNLKVSDEDTAITIESSDGTHSYTYKMSDFDIKYDIEGAADRALSFASDASSSDWQREYYALENGTVNFHTLSFSKDKVQQTVNAIANEVNIKASNATEKRENGAFKVTPSQIGYEMDSKALFDEIIELFDNKDFGKTVKFDIKQTQPKIETSMFEGADKLIGSYTSYYSDGDDNRIQNLKNGCEKLNGQIVYPNEEFSVNACFNPCTEENGWASAGTIVDGEIEDSIGGGMCQVSSTLYDALLEAELNVTERTNHSMKVNYADYAFDATLAGDYLDLKFQNDTKKPVYIEAFLADNNVCINLYGEEIHSPGRTIELYNELVEVTEPGEPIKRNDPDMYEGETRTLYPMNGLTYDLYKNVYENGQFVESVKLNTSVYAARPETTYVGTKQYENTVYEQPEYDNTDYSAETDYAAENYDYSYE